ncbi:glutaredoxin family protein [Neomicrococcus lactis]|uniref:Glutaredoxin n=1 Tax=Neomicrococcus lactis TaxID=732241 RepID=A0A7W9D9T7_9MICC|nr:glutaredoxin family protein [Neomicrococcus lactis]MBB5596928.1 glutaredoxin [Neomicrococcus lactis]
MNHPKIELITNVGCHLCADARDVLDQVTGEVGMTWDEIPLQSSPELAQHADEVPVLRINGVVRDFWVIDPDRLRRLLTERHES